VFPGTDPINSCSSSVQSCPGCRTGFSGTSGDFAADAASRSAICQRSLAIYSSPGTTRFVVTSFVLPVSSLPAVRQWTFFFPFITSTGLSPFLTLAQPAASHAEEMCRSQRAGRGVFLALASVMWRIYAVHAQRYKREVASNDAMA
jgi:hypothetical protein